MELKTYVELNLSAFLVFKSDFPGQEPDQSDADSKPGQENQGRGGSEASLDLPEREGGLGVPQVRLQHTIRPQMSQTITFTSPQARNCGLLEEIQCTKKIERRNIDDNVGLSELLK